MADTLEHPQALRPAAIDDAVADGRERAEGATGGDGHVGGGGGSADAGQSGMLEQMLADGQLFEEAEEARVEGDGHQEATGHGAAAGADDADALSDGIEGRGETVTEAGDVYLEHDEGAAAEVAGYDPELLDFGGENFEIVHGRDDRVRVANTQPYPWRTICKLEITAANGRRFGCSGALIGPRTVLTNGHCVFMHDNGGWARSIRVIPGKNGAAEPYGSATSTFYHSVRGWTQSRSSNYDYAVVVLPSSAKLGNTTGWMGLANLSFTSLMGLNVNSSGYPGDKPYGTQWWNSNNVLAVTARRLFYRLDTYGGQSGSPVWRFRNGQRHIVAVHNTGGSVFNGSVRLAKPVFDNLVRWKNTYT